MTDRPAFTEETMDQQTMADRVIEAFVHHAQTELDALGDMGGALAKSVGEYCSATQRRALRETMRNVLEAYVAVFEELKVMRGDNN